MCQVFARVTGQSSPSSEGVCYSSPPGDWGKGNNLGTEGIYIKRKSKKQWWDLHYFPQILTPREALIHSEDYFILDPCSYLT